MKSLSTFDPDSLTIHGMREDPILIERVVRDQQARYESDPDIRTLLESIYLEPDRAASFERFRNSLEFRTIGKLLNLLGIEPSGRTVELGGGPGFLAWALRQSGWTSVDLVEPNDNPITGTGYLDSLPNRGGVTVYNDLEAWHADLSCYDVVLTKNCIHHFPNIAQVAASIRQKMADGGVWIALREWFADSPQELYKLIATHPYCQTHGVYEWPYPASHYVEAIEMAGLTLEAVVPAGYENGCLAGYVETPAAGMLANYSRHVEEVLQTNRSVTVNHFWHEFIQNRLRQAELRQFTRPQMLLFRRGDIAAATVGPAPGLFVAK